MNDLDGRDRGVDNDEEAHPELTMGFFQRPDTVRVIQWEAMWSAGAPCPIILAGDHSLTILYYGSEEDKDQVWVVSFQRAHAHLFSGISDETLQGHRLYNKGLQFCSAHEVDGSSWLKEIRSVHSVHDRYSAESWSKTKHYVLCFHDNILEVLADGFTTTEHSGSPAQVLKEIIGQVKL